MKNLGKTLIFIGTLSIIFTMIFSFQVFLQGKQPPQVFKKNEVMVSDVFGNLPAGKDQESGEEITMTIGENIPLEDVFPIAQILNLSALSIFAFIIFSGALKLITGGVSIIKGEKSEN